MIDVNELISNLDQLKTGPDVDRLKAAVGTTDSRIIAALIVAQAIHKNTIQQIHTYSAIQDLTSTLRDIIPLLPQTRKAEPP